MTDDNTATQIQGLIFDCDGTLADTMPLHFHAWQSTLQRYKIALDEDRFYSLGGQPTVKIVQLLAGEQGLELDAHVVAHEKEEAFLARLTEVKPIAPIVDIVRANVGKLPMAVASGSHRAVVFDVLKIIGLDDLFGMIVRPTPHARAHPSKLAQYRARMATKNWPRLWPGIRVLEL